MNKNATSKIRLLTKTELGEIREHVEACFKGKNSPTFYGSFNDMVSDAHLSEQEYGRYASPQTSSPLIVQAVRFVSMIAANYTNWGGVPIAAPEGIAKTHYEMLKDKVVTFDHDFFECVSILLRHKKSGGIIADLEWRKMRKFSSSNPKLKQGRATRFDLKNSVELAVFKILVKRVGLKYFDSCRPCNLHAVTRDELREGIRQSQVTLGAPQPNVISESDLSRCLTKTESGRFLAQFMAEMPIATNKQKMLNSRNRE